MHYSRVKSPCSKFRVITANILGVPPNFKDFYGNTPTSETDFFHDRIFIEGIVQREWIFFLLPQLKKKKKKVSNSR